ncbi:MAG: Ig-like domain-containing protein [Chloroflexota bacterium]|nr:Ig-like domain-containing protein [Chloroflexota bacterium]
MGKSRFAFFIALMVALSVGLSGVTPRTWAQETLDPLLVASTIPEAGASDIDTTSDIVVAFDRPVVPLGTTEQMAALPSPVTFDPRIAGAGEWINTSLYVFTPSERLQGSTTYTASVESGFTAVDGAQTPEDFFWTFRTPEPAITNIEPLSEATGIPLDAPIIVTFNQGVDTAAAEAAFTLVNTLTGEPVIGSFAWSENDSVLTFTPDARLAIETPYTVRLALGILSANGEGQTPNEIAATFITVPYPAVLQTLPTDGDQVDTYYRGYGVSIDFNAPINRETLRDRITIDPEPPEWTPEIYDYAPQQVNLRFPLQEDTTYTITIAAGVEDVYGNPTREDFAFSFTTLPPQPDAYPIIAGNFNVTGAYRENTSFAMRIMDNMDIDFELYRMPPDEISQITFSDFNLDGSFLAGYVFTGEMPPWVSEANTVRTWTQSFNTQALEVTFFDVNLVSEAGGQLEPGLYWVTVNLPIVSRMMNGASFVQFALAVSDTNLTVVRSADETLIWATDMESGAPLANATIDVYREGDNIATGMTDADGLFRAPVDLVVEGLPGSYQQAQENIPDARVVITASSAADYGAWYSNIETSLPTERGYLYTDRPVYRPGETVYFRGVLRNRRDMDYSVPDIAQVNITIKENYGERVYFEGALDVTEFGTYSDEFVIPDDAPLGDIVILADFGDGNAYEFGYISSRYDTLRSSSIIFNVAEFRVPEFTVEVAPERDSIIQGDALSALVNTRLYAGGAVGGANVTYRAYGDPTTFMYAGEGRYSFSDDYRREQNNGYFYNESLLNDTTSYEGLTATTNADGQLLFALDSTVAPTEAATPMLITLAADVIDASGQTISDQATLIAHPAAAYVGIGTANSFITPGQPNIIDLITVTPDSAALPNTPIMVETYEVRWERTPSGSTFGDYSWAQSFIQLGTQRITSDGSGRASYAFTPPTAGTFLLRAIVTDADGRENSASNSVYAPDANTVFGSRYGSANRVTLLPDQEQYQPGDTASIIIANPFSDLPIPVSALITVERADIMRAEVVTFEGGSIVYDVPLTDADAPNVFVNVVLVRGMWQAFRYPDYAVGSIELPVEPVRARLNIIAVPSVEQAAPRDSVSFDVTVTDVDGNPVQAELGIALTDEAVLALMERNSATLEAMFYGEQADRVVTGVALSVLIDPLTEAFFSGGRGGGGGGGGGGVLIREDFEYTPLWAPHVVTDENGQATVTVTLPDNLTTWRLDARGVTLETKVGETTAQLVSTLPLFVRPVAPRFMVVGDQVELAAVIQNNTAVEQAIEARLESSGVTLTGDSAQTVTIAAGSSLRVVWTATVEDVEGVDLTFFAVGDGVQDAAKPALRTSEDGLIPVYRYTAPDTTGTGGALFTAGDVTEGIVLPQTETPIDGELRVELSPSLAASALESLDYLRAFPHECIEQTVSRFLPNVVTFAALRDLNIDNPELQSALSVTLTVGVMDLIAAQNDDGGWGWFGGMESNTLVTAYALLGLAEAKIAGFDVEADTTEAAFEFLRADFSEVGLDTPDYVLNRLPVLYYAIARWQQSLDGSGGGNNVLSDSLDALFDYRDQLTVAARAFLLLAYHEVQPDSANIPALITDVADDAILSATGAQWQETTLDWINWGSDTRTTAISLLALARTDAENPLLPNAVRWLMSARRGDHWATTQETAWSVMAFSEWMQISGELEGDYAYTAALNAETLVSETVTPATIIAPTELRIAVADLLTDEANTLNIARSEGTGALYYNAFLETRLPADSVTALNRGVSVTREYFLGANRNERIDSASVGDTITVRLSVVLPQDLFFFALEDPLPAGMESIDLSLLTSDSGTASALYSDEASQRFWFFNGWAYDHIELRDQATFLYADFLPRGTYVYSYQLRATSPGTFQIRPANGYAFYQPDVFGRTDGGTFTVNASE